MSYVEEKERKEKETITTKPLLGEMSVKFINWVVKSLYFSGVALIYAPMQWDRAVSWQVKVVHSGSVAVVGDLGQQDGSGMAKGRH